MDAEEDLDLVKRPEKFQTYGGYSKGMIFTLSLCFVHFNHCSVCNGMQLPPFLFSNELSKGLFSRFVFMSCRLKTLKNIPVLFQIF